MTEVRTCDFCKNNKKKIFTFEKSICMDCIKKLAGYTTGGEDIETDKKE